MLLSTVSTIFFWVGVVIAGVGLLCVLNDIFNRHLDDENRTGLKALGTFIMIIGGLVIGFIVHGGMKAQDIQDDLSNQGFTVASIDTDNNQATVVHDNKLVDVQVYKTGYPQEYHAYLSCPADANLAVSTDGCAALPR